MYQPLFSAIDSTSTGRGFLYEVSRSFVERSVDLSTVSGVATATGVILGTLLLIYLVRRHFESRHEPVAIDMVAGDDSIRHILDRTVTERSRYELQFTSADGKRRATALCTCVHIDDANLTLECSSVAPPRTSWAGRRVDLLFRLQEGACEVFYGFHTTVSGTSLNDEGIVLVHVSLPPMLERKQKRAFLRLTPPPHLIRGIDMWELPPGVSDKGEWSPHRLPPPMATASPDGGDALNLINISGGGLRLQISRDITKKGGLRYDADLRLLLRLALYDPDEGRVLYYWLKCSHRNHFTETETQHTETGLQYREWGVTTAPMASVTWTPARPDGEVEPLTRWTLRRHLELYRSICVS